MTNPVIGQTFTRDNTEIEPVIGDDFSRTLVIETSEDASDTEIPLETAVRFSSSDAEARAALGTGLLADAVRGVRDQLTGINAGADITVFRVAEGATAAETAAAIAAVIDAITEIPSAVKATPRIVIAGRTAFKPAVGINPVLVALQANLGKILAVAPVDIDATTLADTIAIREQLSSERLMPIGVAAKVWEGTDLVTRPMASRVAGLMVRCDKEGGGKPFNPFANQPIYGIADTSRRIPFSLLDGSVEGQMLLAKNISTVEQAESGHDGSSADGGFIFWGTDNAATGELDEQIHQVRGVDYLIVKMMHITRRFLGKNKITVDMAEAWINSLASMMSGHQIDGDILGYTPRSKMFIPDANRPEDIRLGTLGIDAGIEPAPVFKLAHHNIRRYRPAVEGLVADIVARLGAAG